MGGYSFIRFEFEDTMKKLGLAMLFMLAGCWVNLNKRHQSSIGFWG
jgi:hypothetical protein